LDCGFERTGVPPLPAKHGEGRPSLHAIQAAFLKISVRDPRGRPTVFTPWRGALAHAIFIRAGLKPLDDAPAVIVAWTECRTIGVSDTLALTCVGKRLILAASINDRMQRWLARGNRQPKSFMPGKPKASTAGSITQPGTTPRR
jgi:hypothetical protein